jgi:NAD(P)-dependent dehydrogenase (short-subunit alcohol dehydrogenase family)
MLANRLCVVTGANTGIGRIIATELASQGAHVVMACRSKERTVPVALEIQTRTNNSRVEYRHLDLSSLSSVRAFADQLLAEGQPPVSVLVNNAGLMSPAWELTADGLETTWQVNALGPFLLTQLLLPSLLRAAEQGGGAPGSARVVNVGSRLEKTGDVADLKLHNAEVTARFRGSAEAFNTFKAYGTSKLALSSLAFEQARRWKHPGLCITLCTPGMVNTDLSRFAPLWARALSAPLRWLLLRTPQAGADTPVWLSSSTDAAALQSGGYFYDRKLIDASPTARDEAVAQALWDTCVAQSRLA